MIYYTQDEPTFSAIKDKLKPTICKSCIADGDGGYGHCEKCLRNQAWNKEYVETHLFITDNELRGYHTHNHDLIKRIPLRTPGENSYLLYGFEVEMSFDEDQFRVNYYNDEDGYEDECETSSECEEFLIELTKATKGLFVWERDGSLHNGIEGISRAMDYKVVISDEVREILENMQKVAEKWGAWKEQPDGNGMHVHISRKFFEYGELKREGVDKIYQDLDWLFQYFQPELEKIGGRQYTQFCESKMSKIKKEYNIGTNSRRDSLWNVELDVKGKMKKGGNMAAEDHYNAVIRSGNTIEARIFKSTLDPKHILANIELVRNFAHAVRDGEITGKTLNEILHTKDNKYLDEVLDEIRKKIYKEQAMLKKEIKELRAQIRTEQDEIRKENYKHRVKLMTARVKDMALNLDRVEEDEMEIK